MAAMLDLETLLAPIPGDDPCGSDPRQDASFDSPYQQLRDAREEAMSVERVDKSAQADAGNKGFVSDTGKWQVVVDRAVELLETGAKDLEVCALLIEGLARTGGPGGLRDGFEVARELVTRYWGSLYPRLDSADPDSMEDRLSGFIGLNGSSQQGPLPRFILQLPVTDDTGDGQYRCHQYNRALEVSRTSDAESREQLFSAMGFALEDVERAASSSSDQFYISMEADLTAALDELTALDEAFMTACGAEAPPVSLISDALQTVMDAIRFLGRDKLAAHAAEQTAEEDEGQADGEQSASEAAPGKTNQTGAGPISSRQDAVSRMRVIATYFRETEPHSPVSYALENVIRWSTLPLDRLLEEWIEDEQARERYKLMTGMRADGVPPDAD